MIYTVNGEAQAIFSALSRGFVTRSCSYLSDEGVPCSLLLRYRPEDPGQWVMGLVKGNQAVPVLLSSFDITPLIQELGSVTPEAHRINPFMGHIDSALLRLILQKALAKNELPFERVHFLMRTASSSDSFSEPEIEAALFANNPGLDAIIGYGLMEEFYFSFVLIKELLSEASPLQKAIKTIPFTDEEALNKNLLKALLLFYEKDSLKEHRQLIDNPKHIKDYGTYLWNNSQIQLLPFLIEREYSPSLIVRILSKPVYYTNLLLLVKREPALMQDVPQFLDTEAKLKNLEFIHKLEDSKCKLLCLIFWIKGDLSLEEYQNIINATRIYPLLASTLLDLDKTKTVTVAELKEWALNPLQHLPMSIAHHFNFGAPALASLKLTQLEAITASFILLKNSGIKERINYSMVLKKDNKGALLRLFLPQLENKQDKTLLIRILYAAVRESIQTQGTILRSLNDPQQVAQAKNLQERAHCVIQLQNLGLGEKFIELAAQEHSDKARQFRQVIMRVEAQCKIIDARLSGSVSYKTILGNWARNEKQYRITLYQIAYEGLMEPNPKLHSQLKNAEQEVLNCVNPEITSPLQKSLIVISNIIIALLSLTIANFVKYLQTGTPLFFNQTSSGEEWRALNKELGNLLSLSV